MTTHPEDAMTRERTLEEALRKYGDHLVRAKPSEKGGGKMTELSDWKRCVLPDELAAARASGKAEGIAEVVPALEAARATIAELEKRAERLAWEGRCEVEELEKRIGELEAERDEALREHTDMMWQRRRAEENAEAERQRRENCEAALRPFGALVGSKGLLDPDYDPCGVPCPDEDIFFSWGETKITAGNIRAAHAYFSRYPSESDNRTTFRVGEDHSYYGGPDYKCVTAEQCSELEKRFAEAERDIADNPTKVAG